MSEEPTVYDLYKAYIKAGEFDNAKELIELMAEFEIENEETT